MAILKTENKIIFKFYPYRISDNENPIWIQTQIVFSAANKELISDTLSITSMDIEDMIKGMKSLEQTKSFKLTTMDENFIFHVYYDEIPNKIIIEFWFGEPPSFMSGYRFIVDNNSLQNFIGELISDQKNFEGKGN